MPRGPFGLESIDKAEACAIHESGHAVSAFRLGFGPAGVRIGNIGPAYDGVGQTLLTLPARPKRETWKERYGREKKCAIISLAGPVAEARFTGCWDNYGATSDAEHFVDQVTKLFGGETARMQAFGVVVSHATVMLVNDNFEAILRVAAGLLKHGWLDGEEVRRLCRKK